ncbi:MAG: hypothetical protein ACI9T9_002095 [Oleiphilaceae bacterium]|jgi:hypothetical protein
MFRLLVRDICHDENIQSRAQIIQKKTGKPVQLEITKKARAAVKKWIVHATLNLMTIYFKVGSAIQNTYQPNSIY